GQSKPFVFYEPSGVRWRRFIRITQVGGILTILALVSVLLGVLVTPQLPTVILPAVPHRLASSHTHGVTNQVPSPDVLNSQALAKREPSSPSPHPQTEAAAAGRQPLVLGYYVNWDAASIVSLRLHLGALTHLVPEWLTLQNARGDLEDTSDPG